MTKTERKVTRLEELYEFSKAVEEWRPTPIHRLAKDIKTKPKKGGGKSNVEQKPSRSISEMWARMVSNGEISTATRVKSNDSANRNRAVALMKNANESPMYMDPGKLLDIQKKMRLLERVQIQKKKDARDEKIKGKAIEDYKKSISTDNTVDNTTINNSDNKGGNN